MTDVRKKNELFKLKEKCGEVQIDKIDIEIEAKN